MSQSKKVTKEQIEEQVMAAWTEGLEEANQQKNEITVSEAFQEKVKDLTLEIKILMVTTVENYKEVAKKLLQVYNEIFIIAGEQSVNPKERKKIADNAYAEYALFEFNIKKSRAVEYKALACREDILKLELPISHLIELSRLAEKPFSELLKIQNESALRQLSFRQIQSVVKRCNENRKNRAKATDANPEISNVQESQVTNLDSKESMEELSAVTNILQNKIPALDQFVRQFEALELEFKTSEIPTSYAEDLEKIAKWCLAASNIEKKAA